MTQEKRKLSSQRIISGILSFYRPSVITNNKLVISRAFQCLKKEGFSLLQNIMFGNDGGSREIREAFDRFLTTGLVSYKEWGSGVYHLEKGSLKLQRRGLPENFTAEEIVQLSEIAEQLEDMLRVET